MGRTKTKVDEGARELAATADDPAELDGPSNHWKKLQTLFSHVQNLRPLSSLSFTRCRSAALSPHVHSGGIVPDLEYGGAFHVKEDAERVLDGVFGTSSLQ